MSIKKISFLVVSLAAVAGLSVWYFKSKAPKTLCDDCNVIIVAYDAVQAAHVSGLGYDRPTTPTLDKLASGGYSFANTFDAAPWTVPSYMSVFTGLYPTEHKVVNKFVTFTKDQKVIANLEKLSPNVETLAQEFKANGYITGGFTGDAGVHSQFGYGKGFDIYKNNETFGSIATSSDEAVQWLKDNKGKKFFMFLHGYDAHGQFKVAENYKGMFADPNYKGKYKGTPAEQSKLREDGLAGNIKMDQTDIDFWRSWYDSKIRDEDDRFAAFLSQLDQLDLTKKTIIIAISDHGTEFMEHSRFDHGHTLYDELVHVPMIFSIPGFKGGAKINGQVSLMDIAPTLVNILGLKLDKQFESQIRGVSLLPLIKGEKTDGHDVFIETDYREYTHKRGIRTVDGWKLIITMETGAKELYNLKEDPHEIKNVAEANPKLVFDLTERINKHIEEMGDNPFKKWEIGCLPVYNDQCLTK